MQNTPDTIIRLPEVRSRTGLPTSTLYYLMKKGEFPKGFKLGFRAVGWLEADIASWISKKIELGAESHGEKL